MNKIQNGPECIFQITENVMHYMVTKCLNFSKADSNRRKYLKLRVELWRPWCSLGLVVCLQTCTVDVIYSGNESSTQRASRIPQSYSNISLIQMF